MSEIKTTDINIIDIASYLLGLTTIFRHLERGLRPLTEQEKTRLKRCLERLWPDKEQSEYELKYATTLSIDHISSFKGFRKRFGGSPVDIINQLADKLEISEQHNYNTIELVYNLHSIFYNAFHEVLDISFETQPESEPSQS